MSTPDRITLLDVNVLVALTWPTHVHHELVYDWFAGQQRQGWATCPITETGFVRVSANRAVIPYAVRPVQAIALLHELTSLEGHEFWPDDVGGVVGSEIDPALVVEYRQVTDAHLLALTLSRDAALATLDRGLARLAPGDTRRAVVTLA